MARTFLSSLFRTGAGQITQGRFPSDPLWQRVILLIQEPELAGRVGAAGGRGRLLLPSSPEIGHSPGMKRMMSDAVWTFLGAQARTAQCATAEADGHPHGAPGELIARVAPTRVIAKKDVAGW